MKNNENPDCSWKLFSKDSEDCLACMYYPNCKREVDNRDIDALIANHMHTIAVVEDDAKEYAEFIRETDKLNQDMYGAEQILDGKKEVIPDYIKDAKSYKELTPIINFLKSENIPILFLPPYDVFASTFMMVTYKSAMFTVRVTSLKGIAKESNFKGKIHKAKNNKIYRHVRKGTLEEVFPIIVNIVAYRKQHVV